jgi:hypothetical protein
MEILKYVEGCAVENKRYLFGRWLCAGDMSGWVIVIVIVHIRQWNRSALRKQKNLHFGYSFMPIAFDGQYNLSISFKNYRCVEVFKDIFRTILLQTEQKLN